MGGEPQLIGEVCISRHSDCIEITVTAQPLPNPVVYASAPSEPIADFCAQLAVDLGKPGVKADVCTASGAVMSTTMTHGFAWRPGRMVRVGTTRLTVSIVTVSNSAVADAVQPGAHAGARGSTGKPGMKYIVVTGGVVSGLGKGVTASSLGVLMKAAGFRVTSLKIDPYLNVDAGTMSPFEHGEVFTLDDGGEADLDLGNYERFNELTLTSEHNMTTGKIYSQCLEAERRGDYLGKTVQVVPHVTNAIQDWIARVAHIPTDGLDGPPDICIIELGGTVGDIESMPYVEALRQFQFRIGRENILFFHVSLVPVLGSVGEEKTKPTQHGVMSLRAVGLTPDFLVCRSSQPLSIATKSKLSLFCHVPAEHCLGVHDVSNIYRVPLLLHHQGVTANTLARLSLVERRNVPFWNDWRSLAELVDSLDVKLSIAVVGKYTNLSDAYLSVSKALLHASFKAEVKLKIEWIEAEHLAGATDASAHADAWARLKEADGCLVPGGFGDRGVEGKIAAAKYCREEKKPYLGICLGFQTAVLDFARNVCGFKQAHSTEFREGTPHPLVIFMPEGSTTHMGGTMRLGSRRTKLSRQDCHTSRLYGGATAFDERHRHRYEVNIKYVKQMEEAGLEFVGRDTTGERMEVLELKGHPFFVACQFHPEFKSRPLKPSPLFLGLLLASAKQAGKPVAVA